MEMIELKRMIDLKNEVEELEIIQSFISYQFIVNKVHTTEKLFEVIKSRKQQILQEIENYK